MERTTTIVSIKRCACHATCHATPRHATCHATPHASTPTPTPTTCVRGGGVAVRKASDAEKEDAAVRLARLAACLEGSLAWYTLSKTEYEYCTVALESLRVFGAIATGHHREPANEVYRTHVCCSVTGVSRAFHTASPPGSIDMGGGGVSASGKQEAIARIKETFDTMSGKDGKEMYRLWNPAILSGIGYGEAWRATTSVIAYNRETWNMLESSVEGWHDAADINVKVTRRLQHHNMCERYDFLFPADSALLSTFVVAPSMARGDIDGWCGNPECDVRAESGARFQRCSNCQQMSYCCAQCQKRDWSRHKAVCQLSPMFATKTI